MKSSGDFLTEQIFDGIRLKGLMEMGLAKVWDEGPFPSGIKYFG
jgi:hypothetical protein